MQVKQINTCPAVPEQIMPAAVAGVAAVGFQSIICDRPNGEVADKPGFPNWLMDCTQSSHLTWLLKERMLPPIYWQTMLRGREWMAKPQMAA